MNRTLLRCHGPTLEAAATPVAPPSGHQFFAQRRCDLGAEHFDRLHELLVRQGGRVHLKSETRDAAQRFTVSNDLLGNLLRIPDQQRSLRTSLSIEISASDRTPSAFLPNVGK